jgi:hypothetical protein
MASGLILGVRPGTQGSDKEKTRAGEGGSFTKAVCICVRNPFQRRVHRQEKLVAHLKARPVSDDRAKGRKLNELSRAVARSLTNTFAGIGPTGMPPFIVAQLLGAIAAAGLSLWLLRKT